MARLSTPAGFLIVTDRESGKLLDEADMRQCSHCQHTWKYIQGSRRVSGFCFKCNGYICYKPQCSECYPAEQRIEDIESASRNLLSWNARDRLAIDRELSERKRIERAVYRRKLRAEMFD